MEMTELLSRCPRGNRAFHRIPLSWAIRLDPPPCVVLWYVRVHQTTVPLPAAGAGPRTNEPPRVWCKGLRFRPNGCRLYVRHRCFLFTQTTVAAGLIGARDGNTPASGAG